MFSHTAFYCSFKLSQLQPLILSYQDCIIHAGHQSVGLESLIMTN